MKASPVRYLLKSMRILAAAILFALLLQGYGVRVCLAREGSHTQKPLPTAEEIATLPPDGGPEFNRLIHEKSPYLLQHARNPVDWYPWGPEAFARALREGLPVFLSIGYSTCHWCHVMAAESFENEEVAELLNKYFVCIKVDREERPDIDQIYMNATQLLTGSGGWPNSLWLTPEGKPWFAGTYFPREDSFGRPGFKRILVQLAEIWDTRRRDVELSANELSEAIKAMSSAQFGQTQAKLTRELVTGALDGLRTSFDRRLGGFGGAPKFPPHGSLNLIFYEYGRTEDRALLEMAVRTLDAMARGGIRDHIGGGFHRYSTDAEWLVPHFEKMLYDNAQLSKAYVNGYLATGNERYREVAEEIYEWALREMTDKEGGFYSALDADSEGEEGKFYLWTRDEIMAVLGKEEGKLFCRVYNIEKKGNYRDAVTGKTTGANIPYLDGPLEDMAKDEGLPPTELRSRLAKDRKKLLGQRGKRIRPHLDDKVLTSWNGLMIGSLAYGGKHLNEPRYTRAAERAADFILTGMRKDGRLLRTYRDGHAKLNAYLDDYAFLADGLLDLYEATGNERRLDEAKALIDGLVKQFGDNLYGGFYFTSQDHEQLLVRPKDPYDSAIPSGNGMAARVLVRLGGLSGEETYLKTARTSMEAFLPIMQRMPMRTGALALAAAMYFDESPPSGLAAAADALQSDASARTGHVTADAFASRLAVAPGETLQVAVRLTVEDGWHINSNEPLQDYLEPTSIDLGEGGSVIELGTVAYPEGKEVKLAFSPTPLSVYEGEVWIRVPVTVSELVKAGPVPLELRVSVQPCTDVNCLAPETLVLSIPLEADPEARGGEPRHRSVFESTGVAAAISPTAPEKKGFWAMLTDFEADAFVERYGYVAAFAAMYLLGLGLTLTPCVYPIIPITVGYFGTQSQGRWRRQLALAGVFGAGVAVSYAAIGTAAAFSGALFGSVLQNAWVLVGLSTLCVAMGLNAFGFYELRFPGWLMKLGAGGSRGVVGAVVMGLTMGITGASCLAAFIVSLLAFVAQRGNPVLGFSMFLMLGVGFATPFVLLATFSGLLQKVPRSGPWLVYAKKAFGTLLFGAALYFLHTLLPSYVFNSLVFVSLGLAGLYFAFFEGTPVTTKTFKAARLCLGAVFFGLALWWSIPDSAATSGPSIAWQPYSEEAIEKARESGRPVVIDFFADWCVACNELDRLTFSDPRVVEASGDLVMLKADLTRGNTPEAFSLTFRYRIWGFPTVVFIGSDGRERENLRIVQLVPGDVMFDRFQRLKQSP